MADASPRATKRRKLDSPNAEQDSLSTTTTPPQGKRATPRTYSKRGRNAKHNEEDKENETTSKDVLDDINVAPVAPMTQTMSQENGASWDLERQAMASFEEVAARSMQEDAVANGANTIESTRGTRSSGRLKKQTWKLAPAEPATPSRRPQKSPTPASRRGKQATPTLTPVAKDPVGEEITNTPASVASAVLNAVSTLATTPTPTPKKTARIRKPQPPKPTSDVVMSGTSPADGNTPTKAKPTKSNVSKKSLQESYDAPPPAFSLPTIDDAMMNEPSPFNTVAPDLTPTPRKRGRPRKTRIVDEFGFTAIDPLQATPSKRQKASLDQETDEIDPLAAFVRRDVASAKKIALSQVDSAAAKPVSWQDYKEQGQTTVSRPDSSASLANLQKLLQDELFHGPLNNLRKGILRTLTGKERTPLQGLDDEYRKVHHVIEQTVVAGEGNSMLVIGPRGSGKSALVDAAVRDISQQHANDFHVIRLNGFIHTDDKLALREIWRQLGREMDVDDGSMLERSNYADTLSSLLAVLSHPTEQAENQRDGAYSGTDGQISKSVIFIIDEFDLFTSHARQTLLYNLFDIAQARKAPIAVLGLTTRVDVTECLEKRVKSRFSHRSVFLSRPKSLYVFQQICLAALHATSVPVESPMSTNMFEEPSAGLDGILRNAWTSYITALFHESTALTAVLRTIYATSRSVAVAFSAFLLPISTLGPTRVPTDADFASQALLLPDSKLNLIHSLTDLELALLFSAARLDIILNVDTCNFNMAYDEYNTLTEKTRLQTSASGAMAMGSGSRTWSREAALGAWEKLEILELIMPLATAGYGAGAGLADVGRAGKLIRCDVSLEEIGACGADMSGVMKKWCKEI